MTTRCLTTTSRPNHFDESSLASAPTLWTVTELTKASRVIRLSLDGRTHAFATLIMDNPDGDA